MIAQTAMPPYPWQQGLWQNFCQNIHAGRLPHAILLGGVDGLGLEECAHAMARLLLCQSPLEDVACGRCRGCVLLHAGTHPDICMLRPEEGASQIKVDQVRECVEFVAKTAHFNGPKVVVVEQAERMNQNASNALLKSLEEPSGQTVFVLVSSRIQAILPTIRSRCQTMNMTLPSEEQALAWLSEHDLPNVELWLRQAGGAPLKAKEWAKGDYAVMQKKLWSDLQSLAEGRLAAIELAANWHGQSQLDLVQMQLFLIESVVRVSMANEPAPQPLQVLMAMLSDIDTSYLFRFRDKMLMRLALVQRSANLNEQLQCEEMAMDWQSLYQLASRARQQASR